MLRLLTVAALMIAAAARAEPFANGIPRAENVLQTREGRIFISSRQGLHELVPREGAWERWDFPMPGDCRVLGLAEQADMLYAAAQCPAGRRDGQGAFLYALNLTGDAAAFTEIAALPGVAQPNGLAAHGDGDLYLADSGSLTAQGALYRLRMTAGGLQQQVVQGTASTRPNGVRIDGNRIYLSINPPAYVGPSRLVRHELGENGLSDPVELLRSYAFIDDFALVEGGVLVTRLFAGRIDYITEDGQPRHSVSVLMPSSVALGRPPIEAGSLLVTALFPGSLMRLRPEWAPGLRPR